MFRSGREWENRSGMTSVSECATLILVFVESWRFLQVVAWRNGFRRFLFVFVYVSQSWADNVNVNACSLAEITNQIIIVCWYDISRMKWNTFPMLVRQDNCSSHRMMRTKLVKYCCLLSEIEQNHFNCFLKNEGLFCHERAAAVSRKKRQLRFFSLVVHNERVL